MDSDRSALYAMLAGISAQMRSVLSTLYLSAERLAPPEAREADPALDERASFLDQSYFQLLRLVTLLSAAAEYLPPDTPFPLQDGDLAALVSRVCESSADFAKLTGTELRYVCTMEQCLCAYHPQAMEQILYYLLSNAMKFTPEGGKISVSLERSGKNVLLSVADTGCGIPPEKLAHLFEQYLADDEIMDPPPHGLGLGLAVCQRVAQRHGGRLLAVSTPGKGSKFTVEFPWQLSGGKISDVVGEYSGGFNRTLLGLADTLPHEAFTIRSRE